VSTKHIPEIYGRHCLLSYFAEPYGSYFNYLKQITEFQQQNPEVPFISLSYEDVKKVLLFFHLCVYACVCIPNHLVHCLLIKGTDATFCWILSPCGLTDNECADRAAKREAVNNNRYSVVFRRDVQHYWKWCVKTIRIQSISILFYFLIPFWTTLQGLCQVWYRDFPSTLSKQIFERLYMHL